MAPPVTELAWTARWLDGVRAGGSTMSQRRLTSIERYGGGIDAVTAAAMTRGVHLLLVTDDKGKRLVAASHHPFKILC